MYLSAYCLRAGQTVTHPSFIEASLPKQAVVVEVLPNGNTELANGLFLPTDTLTHIETGKVWLAVVNYPQRYLLFSHGKVVSLLYHGTTRERLLMLLRAHVHPAISLCNSSGTRQLGLARLVAQHFLPPPTDLRLMCAVPQDINRLNIKASNLQLVNPADEEDDMARQYMHRPGLSKLTGREVSRIRELSAASHSKRRLANEFAVNHPAISQIVNAITHRYA